MKNIIILIIIVISGNIYAQNGDVIYGIHLGMIEDLTLQKFVIDNSISEIKMTTDNPKIQPQDKIVSIKFYKNGKLKSLNDTYTFQYDSQGKLIHSVNKLIGVEYLISYDVKENIKRIEIQDINPATTFVEKWSGLLEFGYDKSTFDIWSIDAIYIPLKTKKYTIDFIPLSSTSFRQVLSTDTGYKDTLGVFFKDDMNNLIRKKTILDRMLPKVLSEEVFSHNLNNKMIAKHILGTKVHSLFYDYDKNLNVTSCKSDWGITKLVYDEKQRLINKDGEMYFSGGEISFGILYIQDFLLNGSVDYYYEDGYLKKKIVKDKNDKILGFIEVEYIKNQ
jgi:hypothetical protein